jgi:hypothetical protein
MSLLFTLLSLVLFGFFSQEALEDYFYQKVALTSYQRSYPLKKRDQERREREFFQEKTHSSSNKREKKNNPIVDSLSESPSCKESKKVSAGYQYIPSLNLHSLLKDTADHKLTEKLFLHLFDELYSSAYFYSPHLGLKLLKQIRKLATTVEKEGKRKKYLSKPNELADLELEDPFLQEIFYKILKGAQIESSEEGYPSLLKFLTIKTREKTKINLFFAPYELLRALYDEPTAQYIFNLRNNPELKSKKGAPKGELILKEIKSYYGQDSKYQDLITFRVR